MGVQATLVVLLMLASSVKSKKGGVQFWRKDVMLTCPGKTKLKWFDGKEKISENSQTIQIEYKRLLRYRCEYEDYNQTSGFFTKTYFFYVKGRACENCFELDGTFVMLAIIVNVIGTAVGMIYLFRRTKERSSDGPAPSSRPNLPFRSQGQASQQDTYQELLQRSRAANTYASVNRMR